MADPGFPPGGAPTPQGGRQHTILPKFPKNCMKLKEFGPGGGGAHPKFYYVDPPLLFQPSYIGTFPVYLRMALIFTDFPTGSGS